MSHGCHPFHLRVSLLLLPHFRFLSGPSFGMRFFLSGIPQCSHAPIPSRPRPVSERASTCDLKRGAAGRRRTWQTAAPAAKSLKCAPAPALSPGLPEGGQETLLSIFNHFGSFGIVEAQFRFRFRFNHLMQVSPRRRHSAFRETWVIGWTFITFKSFLAAADAAHLCSFAC